MGAKKYDKEKSRVDLVNPQFILGIADVLAYGAKKYGDNYNKIDWGK